MFSIGVGVFIFDYGVQAIYGKKTDATRKTSQTVLFFFNSSSNIILIKPE
jgi:hypothetical protein